MNKLIFITAIISLLAACNNSNNKGLKDNKAEVATSKSVAEISAQLENEPTNAELYYRRANMYYEEKLLDKSLADIEQAIVLNANQPIYLFFKGRVLYAMNKTQDAAKAYEKAIAIKPDFIALNTSSGISSPFDFCTSIAATAPISGVPIVGSVLKKLICLLKACPNSSFVLVTFFSTGTMLQAKATFCILSQFHAEVLDISHLTPTLYKSFFVTSFFILFSDIRRLPA